MLRASVAAAGRVSSPGQAEFPRGVTIPPLKHVPIAVFPLQRFQPLIGDQWPEFEEGIRRGRELFAGRAIWHVNSTARGGGVVELLTSLLAYARGAGVDNRWVVIEAPPEFFKITKRIHNLLHGDPGDGGPLGVAEREIFESVADANAHELARTIRQDDIVFLHDPQTAAMTSTARATGARVVWRCHVGRDVSNEYTRLGWDFLRPYVQEADSYVFSRKEFVWDALASRKVWVVPPSIDVFSPKNQDLTPQAVDAILDAAALRLDAVDAPPVFERMDGTPGRVDRDAEVFGGPIPPTCSLVLQVSRWDRLKDPAGLLTCFAEHCDDPNVHLLLAGPAVEAVADDPEGAEVLDEVRDLRDSLPAGTAERAHLACLPMVDVEENAAIVNALQRRASVIVQKSIEEGFGLTVAEAMWKARPVVASRRGGIQDQIVDGENGVLVDDPLDLDAFGAAIRGLLADPDHAAAMGEAARERVRREFLGTRHLIQYLRLLDEMIS